MRNLLHQSAILAFCFLTVLPSAYAKEKLNQLTRENIADTYVTMQRFAEAENEYLAILGSKAIDLLTCDRVNLKLASTMHITRKYAEAEKRFGSVMVRNIAAFTPQTACDYVNTLIRLNKLQRAAEVANRFNNESAAYRKYQPLQNLIDGLKQNSTVPSMTTVAVNDAPFNIAGSNFWCVSHNGGVLFIHNDSNEAAMLRGAELYFYNGKNSKPYAKVPKTMQTGPACFYNNGSKMIYTDNRYKENQMVRIQKEEPIVTNYLNIVELSYNEKTQEWENPKSVFTDKPFSSICHPSVSEDGERLYFAADFTSGKGGLDIYMSKKTAKGWGEPVNLGLNVNTKNDELYPSISGGVLSFSSNGHKGVGGMDIYIVTLDAEGFPVAETLEHLPYPVNTIYNDYAYTQEVDGENGYLTSDRPNTGNLDAIYSWTKRVQFAEKNPLVEGSQVVAKSAAYTKPAESEQLSAAIAW